MNLKILKLALQYQAAVIKIKLYMLCHIRGYRVKYEGIVTCRE